MKPTAFADAAALHAELQQRGYGRQRADRPPLRPALPAGAGRTQPRQSRRPARSPAELTRRPPPGRRQTELEAIRARCPHIDALAGHMTAFAEMMTARTGSRDLEAWLAAVWKPTTRPACAPSLPASTTTCRRSLTAPCAGTAGRVRGHGMTSIKMIERHVRPRSDLLRKRVILHPA